MSSGGNYTSVWGDLSLAFKYHPLHRSWQSSDGIATLNNLLPNVASLRKGHGITKARFSQNYRIIHLVRKLNESLSKAIKVVRRLIHLLSPRIFHFESQGCGIGGSYQEISAL
jgi:hypothetical protein